MLRATVHTGPLTLEALKGHITSPPFVFTLERIMTVSRDPFNRRQHADVHQETSMRIWRTILRRESCMSRKVAVMLPARLPSSRSRIMQTSTTP